MSGNKPDFRLSEEGLRFPVSLSSKGKQIALTEVARTWTLMWLLAKAAGFRAGPMPDYRSTLPLHVSLLTGSRYSDGTLSFNPAFTDWIMGWPIGWSDSCSPVTGFHHWLRRSRSALSVLVERMKEDDGHEAQP